MPCFLFTYHGHGTWMPDQGRGYVHRTRGLQEPDENMAAVYRAHQRGDAVIFDGALLALLVETARGAGAFLDATMHAAFTEPTHIHVLVSWRHTRSWKSVRGSIQSALSRAMNRQFGKRQWFAENPSRRRVRSFEHFDHLITTYYEKHGGVKWRREINVEAARRRAKKK